MWMDVQKEPGDKRQRLSILVVGTAQKFRAKPSQEYLGHVVDLLDRSMKLFEAEKLMEMIPKNFDVFPSLSQIEEAIPSFRVKPVISSDLDKPWTSRKAPGTPASVEALFMLIEKGLTNCSAFSVGMRYIRATEKELWVWFESWTEGKVHPELEQRKKDLMRPWCESLARKAMEKNV